jgi:hypothetical protein
MSENLGPLGPGDDDPRSPAAPVAEAPLALLPGDDDPRSPARGAPITAAKPLGPGDPTPGDVIDEDLVMLAPAPPGPGSSGGGPLHVTHVPRQPPVETSTMTVDREVDAAAISPQADEENT